MRARTFERTKIRGFQQLIRRPASKEGISREYSRFQGITSCLRSRKWTLQKICRHLTPTPSVLVFLPCPLRDLQYLTRAVNKSTRMIIIDSWRNSRYFFSRLSKSIALQMEMAPCKIMMVPSRSLPVTKAPAATLSIDKAHSNSLYSSMIVKQIITKVWDPL